MVLVLRPVQASEPPAKVFTAEQVAFFEKEVRPILQANCLKCHGGEKVRGGLRLDQPRRRPQGRRPGPAVVARQAGREPAAQGDPLQGRACEMPPTGKLPPEQIDVADASGSKAGLPLARTRPAQPPAHEARQGRRRPRPRTSGRSSPVERPAVPAVEERRPGSRNPIDAFILAKLEAEGPDARRRRPTASRWSAGSYYDLTGLPPTPERGRRVRRRRVARRLREARSTGCSPRRTTARSGAGTGSTSSATPRPTATSATAPSRTPGGTATTSSAAFNDDKPYDRFVREQLAGDELDRDDAGRDHRHRLLPARPLGRRAGRPAAGAATTSSTTSSRRPGRSSSA